MGKLLSQHHRGPEASSSGSRCCLMQELRAEEELCSQPGRGGSGSWHRGLDYAEDFDPAGQDCSATKLLSESVMHGLDEKDTFIGDEVTNNWRKLTVKYPVEQGIVTNWEDMEKIWHHAFYNVLRVDPEEHPLLVTESITNPKANKEKLVEIMFETFGVPALYVAIQDILSLFSSGRTTGFVVNSGDEATYHVAINGGYIMSGTIMNLEVSGQDLSTYLMKLLNDKGYSLKTRAEWEMVRDIKEKLCYVTLDYREEMDTEESSIQKKYKLPDGRDITVGKERFLCPEALFEPSVLGVPFPGLHKNIYESLIKHDFEIRKIFYVNTILCGGNMSFPGMGERVAKEIKEQAPKMTKIKVVVPAECRFSSWFGGSLLTTLNSFQHMWIYDYEYEDCGSSIIHQRQF